jgi:hypothetical protein
LGLIDAEIVSVAQDGYRTAAVTLREGKCGPGGRLGGPSTVHTVTASSPQVRMVQAISRVRISPNPPVEIAMPRGNDRAPQTAAIL